LKQPYVFSKVAVVGSRTFMRLDLVRLLVRLLGRCIIVSGGAIGVDTVAADEARRLGYPEPLIFPANWKKYGKPAGMIRNKQIVVASDGLAIFWDGQSRGTHGALIEAKRSKKPIILVTESDAKVTIEPIGWEHVPGPQARV
jgi:hypothetical protein